MYLAPAYDVGDTLTQVIDGQPVQTWQFRRVRLWKYDARAAVDTDLPGLAALCPLLHAADTALVEQAISIIQRQAPRSQQSNLLSILGMFAAPFVVPEQFVQLVGKEALMTSDLFTYLTKECEAELQAQHQAEVRGLEAQLTSAQHALQQALEVVVAQRFPHAPITMGTTIQRIMDTTQLQQLISAVPHISDLSDLEQRLRQAAE